MTCFVPQGKRVIKNEKHDSFNVLLFVVVVYNLMLLLMLFMF